MEAEKNLKNAAKEKVSMIDWISSIIRSTVIRLRVTEAKVELFKTKAMEQAGVKKELGETDVHIPSEGTVRKVMSEIGLIHKPCRKPNSITKADKDESKSDDLIKRDFQADEPLKNV